MLIPKTKKIQEGEEQNKILIIVNVVGSTGPIRFIVNEDDAVADVVATVLKICAHQGHLPVLGSNFKDFLLFCAATGSDFLDPSERIGLCGARNFLLCKNPQPQLKTTDTEDVKNDKNIPCCSSAEFTVLLFPSCSSAEGSPYRYFTVLLYHYKISTYFTAEFKFEYIIPRLNFSK